MTQEFQQTVNDLHLAECELALWRQFALEAIAGLTGTPAEGYDHPHTGPGQFKADARRLRELVAEKDGRIRHLERACAKQNADVCQTLGAALGYPWFRDDPATFPGATAGDGVCVGAHVAESIADEAAEIGRAHV